MMKDFKGYLGGMVGLLTVWTCAGVAESETGALDKDFDQSLEKILELENTGDFNGGIQLCNDLLPKLASHPDLGKAREIMQRLNQEKRAAGQLSFAIEILGSDRSEERQIARKKLIEAGDVGAILLRKIVRTGSAKEVVAAIDALQEMEDPKASLVFVERLKRESPGPLMQGLCQALEARLSVSDQERCALVEPLRALLEIVKTDDSLARGDVANVLLRCSAECFESQPQPFDHFLKTPGAFDVLKEYVKRAAESTNREMVAWASSRLIDVGMENTSGLIGWWQLNDKEGNIAKDSTTNRLNGILTNTPIWCQDGRGGALRFDGTAKMVSSKRYAFPDITNTFTMTLWAYPMDARVTAPEMDNGVTGTSGQRYAIFPECYYAEESGAGLSIGTNGISVYQHSAGYLPALAVYDAPITGWTHVAVVYEHNQPKIWVNGMLVRTGLASPRIVHPSQHLGDVSGYGYYSGMLRDVRIYNRALTDKEVRMLGLAGAWQPSGMSSLKP